MRPPLLVFDARIDDLIEQVADQRGKDHQRKECVEGTAEPELTHDPNKINYSVKLNPGRSESRSESGTPKSAS